MTNLHVYEQTMMHLNYICFVGINKGHKEKERRSSNEQYSGEIMKKCHLGGVDRGCFWGGVYCEDHIACVPREATYQPINSVVV